MTNHSSTLDSVFHALSDSTRRAIVLRLSRDASAVSELFSPMKMAMPTLLKHISVLEECGLVTTKKIGRERICEMNPNALNATDDWRSTQRAIWEARLDRMEDYVLALQAQERAKEKTHGKRAKRK